MKKTILMLLVAAIPSVMSAQLEVNSDGEVSLATLTQVGRAKVSAGTDFNYSYPSSYAIGLHSRNSNGYYCIGIKGNSSPSNSNGSYSIAVQGIASGGIDGRIYGVIGGINESTKYGAGIYGTLLNHNGVYIPGRFAGYFDGPVKVSGTVTATQFITPSDMRLKENVTYLSDEKESSALANVLDLNVIKYNYIDTPVPDTLSTASLSNDLPKEKEMHYGLSAQELQTMYPDLVREGQDGYLGVNYTELVPVLIRAIQELKEELDAAKGNGPMRKTPSVTSVNSTVATGNVLYQNTPNPFKEQTVIRFKLADNVQNAAICIFDMTGKTLKKLPVSSGMESVSIGGNELSEGMFLYSLIVNGKEIDTKRMIITK